MQNSPQSTGGIETAYLTTAWHPNKAGGSHEEDGLYNRTARDGVGSILRVGSMAI